MSKTIKKTSRAGNVAWTCQLQKIKVHFKNIFLFFLIVFFKCDVGENVFKSEAEYSANFAGLGEGLVFQITFLETEFKVISTLCNQNIFE